MAYESAQGLNFTFSGSTFTLTSISFSKNVSEVDVSTLATAEGSFRMYKPAPLRDGDELSIEFFGIQVPQQTATGQLTFTGAGAPIAAGIPTVALCTSAQIQAAAGELVRGSATFRLSQ